MVRLLSVPSSTTLQLWFFPSSPQLYSLETGLQKKLNIYKHLNLNSKNDQHEVTWVRSLSSSIMSKKGLIPNKAPLQLAGYFQNVNGLRSKLIEISLNVAAPSYDVISFVETYLSNDNKVPELGLNGFNIYRFYNYS